MNKIMSSCVFKYPDFPLFVMRLPSHHASQLHSHEFHELVIVLRGCGRHVTDIEEYPIEAGDVFLIRGEMTHAYADTQSLTIANILFEPQRLCLRLNDIEHLPGYQVLFHVEPMLRRHHEFRGRLKLSADQLADASRLITLMDTEISGESPGYRFMACTYMMQLIGYLSRSYSSAGKPERDPLFRVGELLTYIEQHYETPMTVAELADMAAMSESSLQRTFHTVVGKAPMDYVILVRIEKAAALLRQNTLRITEIALACGFSDSNYFSRVFRRAKGCSPREYRRLGM